MLVIPSRSNGFSINASHIIPSLDGLRPLKGYKRQTPQCFDGLRTSWDNPDMELLTGGTARTA